MNNRYAISENDIKELEELTGRVIKRGSIEIMDNENLSFTFSFKDISTIAIKLNLPSRLKDPKFDSWSFIKTQLVEILGKGKKEIRLFAIDKDGQKEEITDLYWFEEQGIHDFGGEGNNDNYRFELFVNGIKVF